jgi:hypothetical protein
MRFCIIYQIHFHIHIINIYFVRLHHSTWNHRNSGTLFKNDECRNFLLLRGKRLPKMQKYQTIYFMQCVLTVLTVTRHDKITAMK